MVANDVLFVFDGFTLWSSDGTPDGTIALAPSSNYPPADTRETPCGIPLTSGHAAASDDGLLFAGSGSVGIELLRSDGTLGGTRQIANLAPEPALPTQSSSPAALLAVDDALYFTADDGVTGRELWRSDGTAAGTHLVRDIRPPGSGRHAVLRGR